MASYEWNEKSGEFELVERPAREPSPDVAALLSNIDALLSIDKEGTLAPAHMRALLNEATDMLRALDARAAEAERRMPCGHHHSLERRSVESDAVLCAFCESQAMQRDAETMELRYRQERDAARAQLAKAREALEWYGEQARLCRLIHSEGDKGRHALSDDGGKRARATLAEIDGAEPVHTDGLSPDA